MSRLPGPRRMPARVYWRRRLVLFTLVCALVYGFTQLLGGGSGDPTARPARDRPGAATRPLPIAPTSPSLRSC